MLLENIEKEEIKKLYESHGIFLLKEGIGDFFKKLFKIGVNSEDDIARAFKTNAPEFAGLGVYINNSISKSINANNLDDIVKLQKQLMQHFNPSGNPANVELAIEKTKQTLNGYAKSKGKNNFQEIKDEITNKINKNKTIQQANKSGVALTLAEIKERIAFPYLDGGVRISDKYIGNKKNWFDPREEGGGVMDILYSKPKSFITTITRNTNERKNVPYIVVGLRLDKFHPNLEGSALLSRWGNTNARDGYQFATIENTPDLPKNINTILVKEAFNAATANFSDSVPKFSKDVIIGYDELLASTMSNEIPKTVVKNVENLVSSKPNELSKMAVKDAEFKVPTNALANLDSKIAYIIEGQATSNRLPINLYSYKGFNEKLETSKSFIVKLVDPKTNEKYIVVALLPDMSNIQFRQAYFGEFNPNRLNRYIIGAINEKDLPNGDINIIVGKVFNSAKRYYKKIDNFTKDMIKGF
jgi:hypothetical protein